MLLKGVDSSCYTAGLNCPALIVSNADLSDPTANGYTDTVNVTCNNGYTFNETSDSVDVQCLLNGTWSIYPVVCQRRTYAQRIIMQFESQHALLINSI